LSNRKEDILEKAIELFNKKGCITTSTRHIADSLGISVGNLYYHYKNKEDIILDIYNQFMEIISEHLGSVKDGISSAFDFYDFLDTQLEIERKYRFLRLEMNALYANYPNIKEELEISILTKSEEFRVLYNHQIKYGYMKKLDENEMSFIISNTWIIASQWELFWILKKYENEKIRRLHGVLNLLYFIKPYLTIKGLEESNLLTSIEYVKKEIKNAK
jgi:AcrR family transcriptional regulator